MAVGTMSLRNPSYLDVSGPPVTLNFNGVPAANALKALAKLGGYGFIYHTRNSQETVTSSSTFQSSTGISSDQTTTNRPSKEVVSPPVTATFVAENFQKAINMIISSTGLQAKRDGRTIIVGPGALSTNVGSLSSKIYRLNQASAKSAAGYLASLGALIRIPNTFTTTVSQGSATNTGGGSASGGQTTSSTSSTGSTSTQIEAYGGGDGPLSGLVGTTDQRLSTITLVGPPNLVIIGEQYLRQLDIRQRQVALSIRILDVSLGNDKSVDNSFAFRFGNNFIVNRQGEMLANFGSLRPPGSAEAGLPGLYDPIQGNSPIVGAGRFKLPGLNSDGNAFTNQLFPPQRTHPVLQHQPQQPPAAWLRNLQQPGSARGHPGHPWHPTNRHNNSCQWCLGANHDTRNGHHL
jgi:type IV pilus assembly protein PilQ